MKDRNTKEPQYNVCLDIQEKLGLTTLGLMSNQVWHDDPRRLTFLLARYKFVSKMFAGMGKVLEVGCADAFGTRVVRQEIPDVTAVDFDPVFIEDARVRKDEKWNVTYEVHDMLKGPLKGDYEGAYALDVIEHIAPADEISFVGNMVSSLCPTGVTILGSPSLESQQYASPISRAGHINCKTASGMKSLLGNFFHNVFVFSMNDEVVHTGFYPMAHYLFAVGCNRKS